MAKVVFFIRHAKSSWKELGMRDIERPLNKRGKRDAPFMANFLLDKEGPIVDAIISSPANRALTTAKYFGEAFGKSPLVEPGIYEAVNAEIMEIIHLLDNSWEQVLIFGHNPTFTDLANQFSDTLIDNVPTCGIVKVVFEVDHWDKINYGNGKMEAFYFPKNFFKEDGI